MDYEILMRIVLKLVFGAGCYVLAKERNKNKNLAFAMGFIFGIFGLAYYLFIAAKASISQRADYVKCNECDEIFVSTRKYCPSCKKESQKAKKIK